MGLVDRVKNFFSSSKEVASIPSTSYSDYDKQALIDRILDIKDRISRINSFDSSLWSISNASKYEFQSKTMEELEAMRKNLENRLEELKRQASKATNQSEYEKNKWTGEKPKDMTDHDFDRFQRSDDGGR